MDVQSTRALWDFDAVAVGQRGSPIAVSITAEMVSDYAARVRNPNPLYSDEHQRPSIAMPTMIFVVAPIRRHDIAEVNGFLVLERASIGARQTPFAKCVVKWERPITEGDIITSVGQVIDKYERRGSKFVTIRVSATDHRDRPLCVYDYTCIFDYYKGSKRPQEILCDETLLEPKLLNKFGQKKFDGIEVGDHLPRLQITETQETVDGAPTWMDYTGERTIPNIHTDASFAATGMFAGTVNAGITTMGYVVQTLEQWFPAASLYEGGSLEFKAVQPFRPTDTVTFMATIMDKRVVDARQWVDCNVTCTNQIGQLIGVAHAFLNLRGIK